MGDGYEYPICSYRSTLALLISNPSIRPGATLDLSRYTACGLQVGPIQSNELSKKAPRCREALVSIWEMEYSPQRIADRYGDNPTKVLEPDVTYGVCIPGVPSDLRFRSVSALRHPRSVPRAGGRSDVLYEHLHGSPSCP